MFGKDSEAWRKARAETKMKYRSGKQNVENGAGPHFPARLRFLISLHVSPGIFFDTQLAQPTLGAVSSSPGPLDCLNRKYVAILAQDR